MITIDLKGKTALVTGGTSGIGEQIVKTLIQAGCDVIFFGTNVSRADSIIEGIRLQLIPGQKIRFFPVDVANFSAVQEQFVECYREFSSIDFLVNCAGITRDQLMLKMSEADWDQVINVNLKSVFNLTKGVLKSMLKNRFGRIINISSVVGLTGNPGQVNYSASKSGMIGFTQSLAKEVASRNICVNCIAPGFIKTKMTDELNDAQKQALLDKIPLSKFGQPEDIANLVLFLASPLAGYITGEVIAVDGGMTA